MKRFVIILVFAAMLLAMPLKQWGQQPYRQYSEEGVVLNFHTINNVYFRAFLLYRISHDDRFALIREETYGQFTIISKDDDSHFMEEFESFFADAETDFSLLSKIDVTDQMSVWKSSVEAIDYLSIMMDVNTANLRSDNDHCLNSMPFCTSEVIEFEAAYQGGATGESGPEYGCLSSQPYPSWYHMRIHTAGQFIIHMEAHDASGQGHDIDYCIWGPFTDPYAPCVDQLTCNKLVDCSYSTSSVEDVYLGYPIGDHNHTNLADGSCVSTNNNPPHVPAVGEYYILMITNFSQVQQTISFTKTPNSGPGETDCDILPPTVSNDGPYCVGETIRLSARSQSGASYSWSGPGGYTSNQQNPTRPNCTLNMAGPYTCTITVGTQSSSATTDVIVYPMPSANFSFNTVCVGNPTQFTSTSTTNPSGQSIHSYQWNFGDGSTGTGASVSHTYTQAGTYQVTLTVGCGGHCTSTKTQTVTVNAQPTANFTYTTVCQGNATQFTSTSLGLGISSYQWNFGDGQTGSGQSVSHTYAQAGNYQVTLTVATAGDTCSDDITQTVTVNAQPTSNFNYTSVCRGNPTQFTSTATGQGITSYQWNFGDGQTGSGQNVSHTYAQAGDYQVTLTVSTNGQCSDQKTQTVPVYAQPTPSITATPPTVGYGGVATLTANPGVQGSFNFHWEPANMVVNPNNQTTQTVQLFANQIFTVTVTNPNGGCEGETQITVNMDGAGMTAAASADQNELCEGESTTLHVSTSGGTSNYTYSWTPANSLNNPSSQNPVATPPVGSTTYTCHVSDGVTAMDVAVTILVHPNELEEPEVTICDNDTYDFYGQTVQTPGVYEYHTQTEFGCDKLIRLHLYNWETYETPVTDYFCQGDEYTFYGQTLTAAGTYYHTLESEQHCDSVIRLRLVENPSYEYTRTESTCQGGPGYLFDDGQYYQPRTEPYIFHYETTAGCDSTVILSVEEAEYNTRNYYVSICDTEYTWPSTGETFFASGIYSDTLQYGAGICDSVLTLNLELRRSTDTLVRKTSCDRFHWVDSNFDVDMWFEESHSETYDYINDVGCPSQVTLNLTINDHDEVEQSQWDEDTTHILYEGIMGCDRVYWPGDVDGDGIDDYETSDTYNPSDHWFTVSSQEGSPYRRVYQNQAGCDSIVTLPLTLDYTPDPYEILPEDNNAPHWVITATEFQINSYLFNIKERTHPVTCNWPYPIEWRFVKQQNDGEWVEDPSVQWILEPDSTTVPPGKKCRMYVLNYIEDTIWLEATVKNACAPEGVSRRYWFVSSFYDVEEQTISPIDFSVVPNPNNGKMTLKFENLIGKINVKVYDMKGSLIDNFETYSDNGPNSYLYNMKSKVEGIYFFVATSKEGTVAKKVVIQR